MIRRFGPDALKVVYNPKHKKCDRLKVDREHVDHIPEPDLYIGLGWDEDSNTKRKHYRMFYDDELENNEDIFPNKSPFHTVDLMRG
jgi:hypothetical protein